MTEKIYTAGEHVRIIKADPCFNDELGEKQVGLVGTVTTGTDSGGAYIKFPHYAGNLYFLSEEIEPVDATPSEEKVEEAPEKEYFFRKGDHVRFLAGHNDQWTGTEFTVREDAEKNGGLGYRNVKVTITKPSERLAIAYAAGTEVNIGYHKLEKFTPKPEVPSFKEGDRVEFIENYNGGRWKVGDAGTVTVVRSTEFEKYDGKLVNVQMDSGEYMSGAFARRLKHSDKPAPAKFEVGDWVKVTGRNDKYDGIVGQIDKKEWGEFWGVTATDGEKYQFAENKLELTEAPYVPKFKDGDWATVPAGYGDYSGKVFEVTNGDKHKSDNVALHLINPADPYHIWTGWFPTDSLKKADKPWTPKYAVGDWVQVRSGWGDWTGNPAQVLEVPATRGHYYKIKTTKPVGGFGRKEGLFSEGTLDPSEEPFEPTYKVGDWVKVINYMGWNGTIGQVIRERGKSATDNLTKIKVHGKGNIGVFLDNELERTAEPHWTETTPIHSAVREGGRTVVKLEADKWLFIYHEGKDTEKIPTVMYRSAGEAKNLLSKEPEVAVPATK